MLTKEKTVSTVETEDGSGVRVKRLFPNRYLKHYDPFVLFDEFFLEPSAGFPLHPHRGFDGLTYILEGGFHHTDTLGNDAVIMEGGAQRFTAGKGLEHAEMPGTEGMNHGIQIWINLPKRLKGLPPDYQQVEPYDIPTTTEPDATIRTVVGRGSPVRLHTPVEYLDIVAKARRVFHHAPPAASRSFLYLISGSLEIEDETLKPGDAFFFDTVVTVELYAPFHSRFLLVSGKPLNEPIRQHGSFVD